MLYFDRKHDIQHPAMNCAVEDDMRKGKQWDNEPERAYWVDLDRKFGEV